MKNVFLLVAIILSPNLIETGISQESDSTKKLNEPNSQVELRYDYGNPIYGFAMAVKVEKNKIESGLPVWVHVRIKNISDKVQKFYMYNPYKQYVFTVYTPNGKLAYKLKYQQIKESKRRGSAIFSGKDIRPGESFTFRFNLSRRFDLSMEGKYTVECKLEIPSPNKINNKYVFQNLCSKIEHIEIIPSTEDVRRIPLDQEDRPINAEK